MRRYGRSSRLVTLLFWAARSVPLSGARAGRVSVRRARGRVSSCRRSLSLSAPIDSINRATRCVDALMADDHTLAVLDENGAG